MLGSSATPSLYANTTGATPTSPTRPSRLRGLSYLRNYTQTLQSTTLSRLEAPILTRTTSTPVHAGALSPSSLESAPPRPADLNLASTSHRGEGWIPTVQGRSGLDRESLSPTATPPPPSTLPTVSQTQPSTSANMTRNRAATITGEVSSPVRPRGPGANPSTYNDTVSMEPSSINQTSSSKELQPTIRLIPHVEARSSRPSLQFAAVTRTLTAPNSTVRVGRYSERDIPSSDPTSLPVGFKSKVVSRRHCEFWCANGQWYIKDVKSSSGTFLNHLRLSSPGVESRPYPVNDGDVVQLGIDFKGGEEVIFRCVKIRVECNRDWQKGLNSFNTTAHKQLLKGALGRKPRDSDTQSVNTSECSICLNPVAPCQALFVAPCSHVWHYKCIHHLVNGPNWPNFLCPNCRFVADLEAEIEQPEGDEFEDLEEALASSISQQIDQTGTCSAPIEVIENMRREDAGRPFEMSERGNESTRSENVTDDELADLLNHTSISQPAQQSAGDDNIQQMPQPHENADQASQPIAIASSTQRQASGSDSLNMRLATPTSTVQFALATGPQSDILMTPRNDAGPFVLDGAGSDRNGNNSATPNSA